VFAIFDFIQDYFWWWTLGMLLVLGVLIVVFVMIRKNQDED
jgi:hypothetical protein